MSLKLMLQKVPPTRLLHQRYTDFHITITRQLNGCAVRPSEVLYSRGTLSHRTTLHSICEGNSTGKVRNSVLVCSYEHLIDVYRYVIANDLSPTAAEAMRRNVDLNGLGPASAPSNTAEDTFEGVAPTEGTRQPALGKVKVNEGDAWYVNYLPLFQ